MTIGFLAVLALAWIGVFLPATIRARQASPTSTAERFRRRLELLSPRASIGASTGRWVVVPQDFDGLRKVAFARAQRRRRRILTILVLGFLVTLPYAIALGGGAWEIQLAVDACLALYVVLLLEAKRRRIERKAKVRLLSERLDARPQPSWYDSLQAGAGQN